MKKYGCQKVTFKAETIIISIKYLDPNPRVVGLCPTYVELTLYVCLLRKERHVLVSIMWY